MRTIYTGIDIGTYHVKVVVAAPSPDPALPMQILGTGTASSRGLRHGYIIDVKEATKSIREALARASQSAKVPLRSARVALGGVGLDEVRSSAEVTLTASGGIVTERDVERALEESRKRASQRLMNRTIIHTIPLQFRVDGVVVYGKPQGLQGTKLAADTLLVTMLSQHHDDIVEAVEGAGVEVEGLMAAPLAASIVTLTQSQKTAGVVLANIGAETLSLIVFDNDTPVSIKVFPTGSSTITNALALSFQIPPTEAEQMKRGAVVGSDVPHKKMNMILVGQMKDMFALVNVHLKTIGRQRLLPAGIVITGGGSGLANASDIARVVLRLPSQVGQIGYLPRTSSVDATWAVAYGLCRWAYAEDTELRGHTMSDVARGLGRSLKQLLRSLLP
jgi:cell division protein FtsA